MNRSLLRHFILLLLVGILPVSALWAQAPIREQPCAVPEVALTPAQQRLYARLSMADTATTRARIGAGEKQECLIAVDVDYLMYQAFKGNTDQIKQSVYEAIAEVSVIYERELNTKLTVSYFKIWDTQDPYPKTQSDADHLQGVWEWWYKNGNGANIRKNSVMAFTGKDDPNYGGIAYIGNAGLGSTAVIDNFTPNSLISATSFYTYTIAHELGHNFGSVHTHNCAWPGGAIDYCERAEGSCYTGARVYQIGTIMSYCYGVPTFHPLCIEAMNRNVANVNFGLFTQAPATPTFLTTNLTAARPDPFVSWNWTDRTQTYQFQVATDDQFAKVVTDSTVRFAQLQLDDLQAGQTYFVRVKARNTLGESNWSTPARLTVSSATTILPPKLRFPLRNAINVTSPDLVWEPVTEATGYQVQTSYTSTFVSTYDDKTTKTPNYTMTGYYASCSYCSFYWRVRSVKDGQTSDWSAPWQFRRLPRLTTSFPDSLQSTNAFQTTVPIMWSDNTGMEGISTVQLSQNATFSSLVWERTTAFNQLNDQDFTYNLMTNAENLVPNTTYYYRIKTRYRLLNSYETPWKTGSFKAGLIDHKRWTYTNQANSPVMMGNFRDLLVEPSGAVWLATYTGLHRSTDLVNWTTFTSKTTNGVLPNGVQAIGQGQSGNLFATTNQGTFQYNSTSNSWQGLGTGTGNPDGSKYFYASRLLVDKNDRVYITTSSKASYLYEKGSWKTLPVPDFINTSYINSATVDNDGNLWVLTGAYGVGRYNGTTWDVVPVANLPKNFYPYGIVLDKTGAIWVHGPYGIAKLNADQTWQYTGSNTFGPNGTYVTIYQLAFDKQNNPVAVSAYDIHRYNGSAWERLGTNSLTAGSYSGRLAIDDQNRVFVASTLYGLSVYDGRTINATLKAPQYCVGDTVKLPFTANFTSKAAYQIQLSDAGGTQFKPIVGTVANNTATVALPANLPPGNTYRFRLISSDPAIIGDETPAFAVYGIPTVNLAPATSQTICSTTPLALTANAGAGTTYQWLKDGVAVSGATSAIYPTAVAGNYTVKAALNGCAATSAAVMINVLDGVVASITPQGLTSVYAPNTVTLTASTGPTYSYQWIKDGTNLAGATSATYEANVTGTYSVSIANTIGCSAISTGVAVQVAFPLAITQSTTDALLLMPNPVEHTVTVVFGQGGHQPIDLVLTDIGGRVVGRYTMPKDQIQTNLDLSQLAAGSYALTVQTSDQTYVRRLVKR